MFPNHTSHYNASLERNLLLLSRVRIVVKFYIWPLLVLFGLTGNCLAILVLTRRRLIRTSTNNYLTILAAFDSCYLVFTLLLNVGSHPRFAHSSLTQTCLLFLRPLADFSSNAATWLIVCFTLERTLAVAKPIYAKRTCSVRRSRHLICTLLVICFLITLPTYFEKVFNRDVNDAKNENDAWNKTQRRHSSKQKEIFAAFHRLYLVFICVVIIWIPLTLLCICNSILIWYVHRSRRFDSDTQPSNIYNSYFGPPTPPTGLRADCSSNSSPKSTNNNLLNPPLKTPCTFYLRRHARSYNQKRKVTIVLIFCLCVALLLWTPQSLSLTYETLIQSYSQMPPDRRITLLIFNNFANLFLCINASIDFILYCFLSEKFARTCRQIIWRQCSNHMLNSTQRSRMLSMDRTSFIANPATNNVHQQQQQLAANTTNTYYSHLYNFYRHSSNNRRSEKWRKKFVQSLATTNNRSDARVIYHTALTNNKHKFLTIKQAARHELCSSNRSHRSIEKISNTEDDYINNDLEISGNTSISSNRLSPFERISQT